MNGCISKNMSGKKAYYFKTLCSHVAAPCSCLLRRCLLPEHGQAPGDCHVLAGPVSLVTGMYFTQGPAGKTGIQDDSALPALRWVGGVSMALVELSGRPATER